MKFGLCHSGYSCSNVEHGSLNTRHIFLLEEVRSRMQLTGKGAWRRGWDLNPRMEVLQTSPLGLLGTAPRCSQYSEIGGPCQRAGPNRRVAARPGEGAANGRSPQGWSCRSRLPLRPSPDWLRSQKHRP